MDRAFVRRDLRASRWGSQFQSGLLVNADAT
jgi:hypothetical protein